MPKFLNSIDMGGNDVINAANIERRFKKLEKKIASLKAKHKKIKRK